MSQHAAQYSRQTNAAVILHGFENPRRDIHVGRIGDSPQDGERQPVLSSKLRRNMAFHIHRRRLRCRKSTAFRACANDAVTALDGARHGIQCRSQTCRPSLITDHPCVVRCNHRVRYD